MYLKIQGVLLRVLDYSDGDVLLTVLTQKHGKLTVKAKGVHRKNSPLSAVCQLFAYCEFTLFEYKGKYTLNEGRILELFHNIRTEIEKFALASYLAHIAEDLAQEDYPTPELQALLLNCFYALSELNMPLDKIKTVFELRAACISGYTPELFGCHICGSQSPDRFDLSAGMLECSGCRSAESLGIRMPVTPAILEAMRYICFCDPKRIFSFRLENPHMNQLSSITESYLSTQLEHSFSATLGFYKSLFFTGSDPDPT